jgi:surface protein
MLTHNGIVMNIGGLWMYPKIIDLPVNTIRFTFTDLTYDPRTEEIWSNQSPWTKVWNNPNTWDYTHTGLGDFTKTGGTLDPGVWNDRNFNVEIVDCNIPNCYYGKAFTKCNNLVKVNALGGTPTNCNYAFSQTSIQTMPMIDMSQSTNMDGMFSGCTQLQSVPVWNTSGVYYMQFIFWDCSNLRSLPNWDTSNVQNMESYCHCTTGNNNYYISEIPDYDVSSVSNARYAFAGLRNVRTGMYRMYQKLLARGEQLTYHNNVFYQTGTDTEEGRAERALIPEEWGGDLVE